MSTLLPPRHRPDGGPLNDMLHWLRRHMGRAHGALAALATLGFLAAIAAFAAFAIVAAAVAAGLTQGADEYALRWLAARRTPALDLAMTHLTTLGNTTVLALPLATAALALAVTGHRWSVLLLLFAGVGGVLINTAFKEFFDRARPEIVEALAHVMSPSFPSGHAMNALVVYGSIAWTLGRLGPAGTTRATWGVAALLVIGIGFSRVYLGVHYPSDVIAGWLAGAAWLVLLPAGIEALRWFDPSDGREHEGSPR